MKRYIGVLAWDQLHSLGTERTHKGGALIASGLAAEMSLIRTVVKTVDMPAGVARKRQEVKKGAVRMLAMGSD